MINTNFRPINPAEASTITAQSKAGNLKPKSFSDKLSNAYRDYMYPPCPLERCDQRIRFCAEQKNSHAVCDELSPTNEEVFKNLGFRTEFDESPLTGDRHTFIYWDHLGEK